MKPKEVTRRESSWSSQGVETPTEAPDVRGAPGFTACGEGRLMINTDTRNLRDVRGGPAPEHVVLLKRPPFLPFPGEVCEPGFEGGNSTQLFSFTITFGISDEIFKRKAFTGVYKLTIRLQ